MPAYKDDFSKRLSEYPEGKPDFEAMFLALEKRKSEWNHAQNRAKAKSGWTTRRVIMTAAAGAFAIVIMGTTVHQTIIQKQEQGYLSQHAVVGQRVNAWAEQSSIKVSVDQVIGSPSLNSDGTSLEYHLSMDVPNAEQYEQAFFDFGILSNLDTGNTKETIGNSIRFTKSNGTFTANFETLMEEDLSSSPNRYRLELRDLYLRKIVKIPLSEGKNEINSEKVSSLTILSSAPLNQKWVVRYKMKEKSERSKEFKNEWRNDTESGNYQFALEAGGRTITSTSGPSGAGQYTEVFDISGLSDKELAEAKVYFIYPETVDSVKGTWSMEFTVDGAAASQPSSTYPLRIAPKELNGFGFVPESLNFAPRNITIPIRGYSREYRDGQILLNDVQLRIGSRTIQGYLTSNSDMLMFMLEPPYQDYSHESATLILNNALVVHNNPVLQWTAISEPSETKQTTKYALDADNVIEYTYYRKNQGIMVVTKSEKGAPVSFMGTRLRINGKVVEPNDNQSWNSGEGKRFDYYDHIPKNSKLEIHPGIYLVEDKSYNQEIKLK
ncbi:hypothetical protein AK95_15405 [Paenibacillus sp. LC231]|uniref:hypothetical protein n=1 Tax=Paenibacillus sp. LC231 TaxID=1120679 RepID=UPI0008DD8946|nr:hypothetical protein [Paenibacillus sp. LC231]OIB04994.1 hypothetical protein AK95_15405 [Paenibacillus sp. LC231]